jgi:hypothetical protein
MANVTVRYIVDDVDAALTDRRHSPVAPSMFSRIRSAWPL